MREPLCPSCIIDWNFSGFTQQDEAQCFSFLPVMSLSLGLLSLAACPPSLWQTKTANHRLWCKGTIKFWDAQEKLPRISQIPRRMERKWNGTERNWVDDFLKEIGIIRIIQVTGTAGTSTRGFCPSRNGGAEWGGRGQSEAYGKIFRTVTESFSARCGKCFRMWRKNRLPALFLIDGVFFFIYFPYICMHFWYNKLNNLFVQ